MREPDSALDQLAYQVIGAAIAVHRALGPGYLESVYEEALHLELRDRGLPVVRQAVVTVRYKDRAVGEERLDLLIADSIFVELKAVEALAPVHTAQVIS